MGIFAAQPFALVYWSGRNIVSGIKVIIAATDIHCLFVERQLFSGCFDECSIMGWPLALLYSLPLLRRPIQLRR